MSLTSFIKQPEVRATFGNLHPDIERKLQVPLQAEPRSRRWGLVGTAFDYLFRFELQRRAPSAKVRPWVAEHAADRVRHANIHGWEIQVLPPGEPAFVGAPPGGYVRTARKIERVVDTVAQAVAEYLVGGIPDVGHVTSLAAHALRLAKLDLVHRQGILDTSFAEAAPEDVDDLVTMLDLVRWEEFVSDGPILLNPGFVHAAGFVGGADADLITGDLLVEIKATKGNRISSEHLDQLLGYFLLSRRHRKRARRFPKIQRIGIYFARHGHLLSLDTKVWTANPEFKRIEAWFFEHATASVVRTG